jgi:hypothetical protein
MVPSWLQILKYGANIYKICDAKYIKRTTNALRFYGWKLLNSVHQHVSATHVGIFRMVRTETRIQLKCDQTNPQNKNCIFCV